MKSAKKRFGISLGTLSNGRVGLTHYGPSIMRQALTIAIRYAAVRTQFGPNGKEETAILEYQSHVTITVNVTSMFQFFVCIILCFVIDRIIG